jgi:hypothetical protein
MDPVAVCVARNDFLSERKQRTLLDFLSPREPACFSPAKTTLFASVPNKHPRLACVKRRWRFTQIRRYALACSQRSGQSLELTEKSEDCQMIRVLVLSSIMLSLAGCGVADTGAAAAAEAAAKAQEAHQGLQTEARVKEQLDAASKAAADQRNAADAASQ